MDDCPPMGDHAQYREIMTKLFIDGDDPADVWWTDSDGKSHRLTEPQRSKVRGRPDKDQMDAARALHAQIQAAKQATARGLASPDDE